MTDLDSTFSLHMFHTFRIFGMMSFCSQRIRLLGLQSEDQLTHQHKGQLNYQGDHSGQNKEDR